MDTLARLTVLYECTRALGVQRDLDALLDEVLVRAQELIECEHSALLLFDPAAGQLEVRCARGYGEQRRAILGLRLPLGRGLTGWAAANRQAVRVSDVTTDPRYVVGLKEARSNMAVPLLVRNELVGVLNLESTRTEAFSQEHEKLCTVLGTQAALAIEASRSRDHLEQRLSELDALYRVSRLASEARDLRGVLEGILDVTRALLPDGLAALLLRDLESDELVVGAWRGPCAPGPDERLPIGAGCVGRSVLTAQVVLVDEPPAGARAADAALGGGEVAAPLLVDGRVTGVLYAAASAPRTLTRDHARVLTVLAQQAALVLSAAQMREELERLATTDPLTGLHNRRHFMRALEEHLRRGRRYGGRVAAVALDLDGFKMLNDRHGHAAGDQALRGVAALMRRCLRETDVLARVGGDEFAALLVEADADEALAVIERLRAEVGAAPLAPAVVTVSAGVALFPQHATDAESLLRCADAAMYEAKRLGRNRVESAVVPAV